MRAACHVGHAPCLLPNMCVYLSAELLNNFQNETVVYVRAGGSTNVGCVQPYLLMLASIYLLVFLISRVGIHNTWRS